MLVLSTFTDIRIPLTRLPERLSEIDVAYFLDPADKSDFVNESNVGEALDRIGASDYNRLYETLALSAVHQYKIPITRMHGDTTTISFYGDYDIERLELSESEQEALLHIERGYNKDGRPQCKQVIVGQIVSEHGIPLVSQTMDGATSDISWNREAIKYISQLAETGFTQGIFVADCKLVIEEHISTMNNPERRIQFVSRCPANFHDKLERRMIAKAYAADQWQIIGPVTERKNATQYKSSSINEEICGAPMRLMVLESDTLEQKARQALDKKEAALAPLVKTLEKSEWKCQPDAEAQRDRFMAKKELALFDCDIQITKETKEKWPRGRHSAAIKPTTEETYRLKVQKITRSKSACQEFMQQETCFVLISNVPTSDISDQDLLKIYKGQQVVENSFRMLKSPQVASVIYLKSQTRIQVLTMLLTFSLLLRALIQYRLREGLESYQKTHPGETIRAGWGGRPLKSPTYKLLYEHSINCYFERESEDQYSFAWPCAEAATRVGSLLALMGFTLEQFIK
jgi:transposase